MKSIKCNKQVIFIDACNSGAFTDKFALKGAAEETALAKLGRASGTVIFASTTASQFAAEVKELKHGIFTYSVINAFDNMGFNNNGELLISRIKGHLNDEIPELTKKYRNKRQDPKAFDYGMDFPIGMK